MAASCCYIPCKMLGSQLTSSFVSTDSKKRPRLITRECKKGPFCVIKLKRNSEQNLFTYNPGENALVCTIIHYFVKKLNYAENNCLLSERPALLIEVLSDKGLVRWQVITIYLDWRTLQSFLVVIQF